MKRKITYCAAVAAMLCTVSCSDNAQETGPAPQETLCSVIEQPEDPSRSRTALSGESVVWTADDKIQVINSNEPNRSAVFGLIEGRETSTGVFSGEALGAGDRWAVYPASDFQSAESDKVTVSLPATQIYMESSFGKNANPMIGRTTENGDLAFRNLCGAIKLQLKGTATVESIKVESAGGEIIDGTWAVSMDYADAPQLSPISGATTVRLAASDSKKGIDKALSTDTATPFYIVMPAGEYAAGMKFIIIDSDGNAHEHTTKAPLTINRSKVLPLKALEVNKPVFSDANFRNALLATYGTDANPDTSTQLFPTPCGTDIDLSSPGLATIRNISILSSDNNVKSLAGIDNFKALYMLSMTNQPIAELDPSLLAPSCAMIVIADCSLTSFDCYRLQNPSNIMGLWLHGNSITDIDITPVSGLVTKNANNALSIGAQKTGNINVTMTSDQVAKYNSTWINANGTNNTNVTVVEKK